MAQHTRYDIMKNYGVKNKLQMEGLKMKGGSWWLRNSRGTCMETFAGLFQVWNWFLIRKCS